MTEAGLKAVHTISQEGIKTNVTLIFSAAQGLIAAKAGATYVSPFIGRLDDIASDGIQLVSDLREILIIMILIRRSSQPAFEILDTLKRLP